MAFVRGSVVINYGGKLLSQASDSVVKYVGGSKVIVSLDEDEASYHDIKDLMKQKGYNEYNVNFVDPNCGLVRLHSDDSSRRFGELIREGTAVAIYVEHGPGINRLYVSFDSNLNLEADWEIGVESVTAAARGKGIQTEVETENNIEADREIDDSESSDDDSVDDIGLDDIPDDDAADDVEVQGARRKLKAAAKTGEKNVVDGLLDALRTLHGPSIDLRNTFGHQAKVRKQFDADDDASSEDSYDSQLDEDEESDVEQAQRRKQGRFNYYDPSNKIPVFQAGMYFSGGIVQFRRALDDYAIFSHRNIVNVKNDTKRVRARCAVGCPWVVYASYNEDRDFQIKTYNNNHNCTVVLNNKRLGSRWLADKFAKTFKAMPNLRPRQLQSLVQEELGVSAKIDLCRTARKLAMSELYGEVVVQYSRLWDYVEELKLKNPGSTIDLVVEENEKGEQVFKRLYVCFKAMRDGFVEGCRKVIGVDGCFLKGVVKGELLVCVGRDANNQMVPVACAQVEVEDGESWGWFFSHLVADLNIQNQGEGWAIISDRQKGLINAIADIFPFIYHRACARHIFCKWRKTHRGKEFAKLFWKCAKAPNMEWFDNVLKELEQKSAAALVDIMEVHPQHWCRAYFKDDVKSDIIDNNLCEAYNGAIITYRCLPIVDFFERMRVMAMKRLIAKYEETLKWDSDIGPRIKKILEENT